MYLDLRYDVGKQERFLNSPICRKMLNKLSFALFIGLLKMKFKR